MNHPYLTTLRMHAVLKIGEKSAFILHKRELLACLHVACDATS